MEIHFIFYFFFVVQHYSEYNHNTNLKKINQSHQKLSKTILFFKIFVSHTKKTGEMVFCPIKNSQLTKYLKINGL